jgi:two-component system cell cycle sensor histidine kinase/response regulator CckA
MFHIFLLVVFMCMIATSTITLQLAPLTLRRILGGSFIHLILIVALITIRLGYHRAAGLVYLAGVWIWATVLISSNAGIRNALIIIYGTLPVSAAWLLGYGAALWMSGVCTVTVLAFAILEMAGMAPRLTFTPTPLGIWFFAVFTMLAGTIPVGTVIRKLLATLAERRQIGEALQESEERFRNMANTAPVMIWVSGPDQLCTFFNKRWLDFRGRTLEQELGKGWVESVHPDDRDRCSAIFHSAFDSRRPFQKECRLRRADGQYRWVLDNGTPLYRAGEFVGFIGSCIDITEQKLIEERLRASEGRLMNAQRLARLGCWERDDATGITEFSDEMLSILGRPDYPPRTLAEFLNYVHPEDRERVREGALRARSTGTSVEGEYRIIRADSEVRVVRSVLEAIRNERGAVIRVVGATQDITDLKDAQEESAARQKLESVGTLASGIAHDFNNLLGGVLAQAELGLSVVVAKNNPEEELKAIRDVAIRGSEIVRQLMIYAGKESELVESVDLSKIVEEMLPLLKVSLSKHAVLNADLGQHLPATRASSAQLRQIVMNLVTNASEAVGERDGVVRVTTRCVKLGPDSSEAISDRLPDGDYLQLEVADSGCGMSPETRTRLFDPFFTTKSAGHGLGLAVVDGIVRSCGGAIRVTSELGKGTTFQILLPCMETPSEATDHPLSTTEELITPSKQAIVLIVEDEDALRLPVAKMLRNAGFQVVEAADGSSAIDLLRAAVDKIDLILLDITIPGASSAEVVAEAARTRPDIRVILTSAYSQEMLTAPLSASQVRAFIRKPFQFGDLVTTLRRAASA